MFLSKSHLFKFCNYLYPTRGLVLLFKGRFILSLWLYFKLVLYLWLTSGALGGSQ